LVGIKDYLFSIAILQLKNLESLLMMIETLDHSLAFTVPKLACVSLVAVFQDILPLYPIKHFNEEGSKRM